jgi:hypothetical protein
MSTTIKKTVRIGPGETFVKPDGATIITLLTSEEAVVESDCTLPDETLRSCYKFKWESEAGDEFLGMVINGVEYLFSDWPTTPLFSKRGQFAVYYMIQNQPDLAILTKGFCEDETSSGDPMKSEIVIAAPGNISVPELIFFDDMSTGGFKYYIKGELETGCTDCNTFTA